MRKVNLWIAMPKHLVSQKELSEYLLSLFTERFADVTRRVSWTFVPKRWGLRCRSTSTLLSYVCQGQIRAEKQMKFFFVNFFLFLFLWKSVWMLTVVNGQEDGCRWTCSLHVGMWNPGDDKLMPRNSFLFAIHGFHSKSYNPPAELESNTNSDGTCVRRSWDTFLFSITRTNWTLAAAASSRKLYEVNVCIFQHPFRNPTKWKENSP